MYFLLRTAIVSVLVGFISTAILRAGVFDLPDCDSSYVHIDSLYSHSLLAPLTGSQVSGDEGEWWTGVGVIAGQDTVLRIFPESISLQDAGSLIDTITTARVFDYLAVQTVRAAIDEGYLTPNGYVNRRQVRVYAPACVQRLGSGSTTLFVEAFSCSASYRNLEYWLSSQGSVEVAIVDSGIDVECGFGYESTVDTDGGITILSGFDGSLSLIRHRPV